MQAQAISALLCDNAVQAQLDGFVDMGTLSRPATAAPSAVDHRPQRYMFETPSDTRKPGVVSGLDFTCESLQSLSYNTVLQRVSTH